MAGIKGNKSHANKTSFPNQRNWSNKKAPAVVLRKFKEMYENAKTDDNILCFQDACMSIGWRSSKVDYWAKKIPTFGSLKTDIQNIIVSRVNKNALFGDFNATASIWRMKQLGEIDKQETNLKNDGGKFEAPIIPSKEEIKSISDNLDDV